MQEELERLEKLEKEQKEHEREMEKISMKKKNKIMVFGNQEPLLSTNHSKNVFQRLHIG